MDVTLTIEEFIRHLQSTGYAVSTVELYVAGLRRFGAFLNQRRVTDLRKISPAVIEEYRIDIMSQSISPETKALRLRPVKRLFEYLVRSNRLLINPTENLIEIRRRYRKIGPVLSQKQMERLLRQPDLRKLIGIRDRAIMEILYSTGIRLGELLGLQINDVNSDDRVVFIRRGKGAIQRVVPLGSQAVEFLNMYLSGARPVHAEGDNNTKALFLTHAGNPMTEGAIRLLLRKYQQMAKIKKSASPHVFRRSCATHLLQNGADIRFVQQLLGHSSLRVTNYYTKILPVEVKKIHTQTHPGVDDAGYRHSY
jgi:site-specific recombinase XerD